MPVIKAFDLAYGRLRSPDLDRQEAFLTDFGMVRADRTKTALYMRGTDAPHHIHVTELGEPRYVGIAVHAASMEDLERVSQVGRRLADREHRRARRRQARAPDRPDGYQVEVVHGMDNARADPAPAAGGQLRRRQAAPQGRALPAFRAAGRRTSSASAIS